VIELEFGILVYPPRPEPGQAGRTKRPARWRAVWYEDGERQQCESVSEEKLAAELEKVKVRLEADAPNMRLPGADLIAHYLDQDRLPPDGRWSRKHAHTQRRLCERFAAPVIATVTCQDIKMRHTQKIVNAAPTAGEGARVAGMLSALVGAGIEGGYLANPRLAKVHWQAAGRQLPPDQVTVAGESALLWVDPAEIPADDDIGKLGRALADGRHGDRDELMANTAAYSGLRWGELTALTIPQIDTEARVITVDRKVIEVAGHLYIEAPKGRKSRKTIYPRSIRISKISPGRNSLTVPSSCSRPASSASVAIACGLPARWWGLLSRACMVLLWLIWRVFIGTEMRLDVGFYAAQARLAHLARGGLLRRASDDAYGEWGTGLVRISPLDAALGMSRLVAVRFRDMVTHEDSVIWAMRWEAIDPGGALVPALDADIRLTPAGEDATMLAVSGAYRPPLGGLGAGLDRASLHPVAQATIRAFTNHIGAAIAPCRPTLARPYRGTAGGFSLA